MRKSTIPFLLINGLALLLFSCGSNPVKALAEQPVGNGVYQATYFSDPQIDYVYKTNITVYGNELSGIFIAKKINETTHRVVFTTEFGNKLLDFEISASDFKVNSIVEELDRKMLINTLVADFRLLLREKYDIQAQFEAGENNVLQSRSGNRYNYLYVSKSGGKLSQIRHASKRKEQINIQYISENNIFADKIVIQHYNLKLRIEFNYFKNQ
ncbi:hypothetical protein [Flavobacterium sp.]|uniref:hypothetical protein n=1 Tax=Flavobacterium sp. TaxID=239 RepID=UPI0039E4E1EC